MSMSRCEKLEEAINSHNNIQDLLQDIVLSKCNSRYLLETAFAAKNSKAVIELIEKGVDINAFNSEGATTYFWVLDKLNHWAIAVDKL